MFQPCFADAAITILYRNPDFSGHFELRFRHQLPALLCVDGVDVETVVFSQPRGEQPDRQSRLREQSLTDAAARPR